MPDEGVGGADPPIIITDGSVTVDFGTSHGHFQANGQGQYRRTDKRITRIQITGDGLDINEDLATGDVMIKVFYG
ncbi:MAG TPA: hypothetical protein VEX60_12045 [Pyrinomonadaceae bacterium]|nr:hypothetical protein [Pyrinomonadaceae bacterium]